MGWSGGSILLEDVVRAIEKCFDAEEYHEELVSVYEELIDLFENCDADTLDEIIGASESLDQAFRNVRPEFFEVD